MAAQVSAARTGRWKTGLVRAWPRSPPAETTSKAGRFGCRVLAIHDSVALTHSYMGIYDPRMARAATTSDAFNAVAEPRRRQILDLLGGAEHPVNDLVRLLGVPQPQVSKHLRILRAVGAVEVRDEGRRRVYRLNGHALKPIYDWVKRYERTWSERFEALDAVLEQLKYQEAEDDGGAE
jgi:DNA-binding transcriptional ArsR family regulator